MSTDARSPLRLDPARAALFFFGACVLAFVWAQIDLLSRNGFWIDEYFSIWASDPATPLSALFAARILPDTNPPLYFTLLALARTLIEDPRAAFLVLNVAAIALTVAFVLVSGRRAGMPGTARLVAALFLISGPVLCYAPEGRAYLMGLCSAFAIAWAAALAVERGVDRRGLIGFAILGVLAALTHVFAALFAGAFAAGLLAEGVLRRRFDVARAGLALGLAAVVVFGVWLLFVLEHMGKIAWIEFTVQAIRDSVWYVRQLAFGHVVIALALVAFLAWSARRAAMRPHLRVFAIGMALFAVLPILASFFTPLITGRYWLIGAPAILVLAVLALRAELAHADAPAPAGGRALAGAGFAMAALLAASALGFANAQAFTMAKPMWRGAAIATPLLGACGPNEVRVAGPLYATASGAPESVFLDVETQPVPPGASPGACPVLGWAEHVRRGDDYLTTASDAELLSMLHLEGAPEVQILRHASGFVVLRADARENGETR